MNIMALSLSALAAAAALTFPWIRETQRLRALGAPGDEDGGNGGGGGDKDRKSPPQPDHCSPGKPCTKGKDGDEMRAPQ
jgi:hypothetical protein